VKLSTVVTYFGMLNKEFWYIFSFALSDHHQTSSKIQYTSPFRWELVVMKVILLIAWIYP